MTAVPSAHRAGVFGSDAPNGYIAIVLYDEDGLAMRWEVRRDLYTPQMTAPFQAWVKQHGERRLELLG